MAGRGNIETLVEQLLIRISINYGIGSTNH